MSFYFLYAFCSSTLPFLDSSSTIPVAKGRVEKESRKTKFFDFQLVIDPKLFIYKQAKINTPGANCRSTVPSPQLTHRKLACSMSNSFKNYSLRARRSLTPLDTSNPNFNKSVSPVRPSAVKARTASAKPAATKKTPAAKYSSGSRSIENRDREIERLNRLLDGGRSFEAVSMEANMKNSERLLAHQNMQEKNHELERQLQELLRNDTKRSDRDFSQCQIILFYLIINIW
ncbi:hypothetical protein BpHYR1_027395 [Brachionus plicatilis]|uniref:Uncharacterized protein n=1 Tax=Brachionus plicatilis TaxID=10195 RepID=A0A3M7QGM9_BRAPC|nr:hypothetical protein BpHYR1_027395 [Brachionus plicatilis]